MRVTGIFQGRLFNNLRFWAYAKVKHCTEYPTFYAAVEQEGFSMNSQFISSSDKGCLLHKEVMSTAKSISTYTWNRRFGKFRRKGIMDLPDDMPQKKKESLGANYTNRIRTHTVKERILQAAQELKAQGTPITQKSVSIRADVSIPTIKRNWSEVEGLLNLYA